MKRMIRWLEAKLFRSKSVYPPVNPASTKPDKDEFDLPKDMQDLVNDAPSPDDVETDDGDTLPILSLDDQFLSDTDKGIGINPYNTA